MTSRNKTLERPQLYFRVRVGRSLHDSFALYRTVYDLHKDRFEGRGGISANAERNAYREPSSMLRFPVVDLFLRLYHQSTSDAEMVEKLIRLAAMTDADLMRAAPPPFAWRFCHAPAVVSAAANPLYHTHDDKVAFTRAGRRKHKISDNDYRHLYYIFRFHQPYTKATRRTTATRHSKRSAMYRLRWAEDIWASAAAATARKRLASRVERLRAGRTKDLLAF